MASFPQSEQTIPSGGNQGDAFLFGYCLQQLTKVTERYTLEPYRSRQLWDALYRQRVSSIEQITVLPKSARDRLLADGYSVGLPEITRIFTSADGTERYLMACSGDGEAVEAVWMPNGDLGERGDGSEAADEESIESASLGGISDTESDRSRRATICISSQAGCAVNCHFCLTATLGLKRNLTPGEIAGQVVAILNRHRVRLGSDRINLVFMGMGEPFLNYDNFMAAVRLLVEGVGIPPSRMTVSTSGILPGIERFAAEQETIRPKLALSLNAPNDAVREAIMPVTRKWNIDALLSALRQIPLRPREKLTFEYVLLGGVNDQPEHARELAELLRGSGLPAKVNLIAWNPGPEIPYRMPSTEDIGAFQQHLILSGIPAFLRRPRGRDIFAACGQLKRTTG